MKICGTSWRGPAALAALLALAAAFASTAAAGKGNSTTCAGVIGPVVVHGELVVPSGATCELAGTTVLGSVEVEPTASLTATGASISGRVDCDASACQLDSTAVGGALRGTGGAMVRAVGGSIQALWCADEGTDCQLDLTADLVRAAVANDAQAEQHAAITVTGAKVGGSVLCNNCGGFNVDSADVDGNVSSKNRQGLSVITNNTVAGNVQVMFGNAVVAYANTIGGSLQLTQNDGALNIFTNTVAGNLLVTANGGETTLVDNHMGGAIVCANSAVYGAANTARRVNGNCGVIAV